MDISKEIKKMMLEKDINLATLAENLNTSSPNLSAKLRKNNFRINELIEIINILGYDLKIEFIEKE